MYVHTRHLTPTAACIDPVCTSTTHQSSWAPVSASMELSTLYASALSMFSVKADVGKVIDIRDGSLTTAMLTERLGGARR